MVDDEKLKNLEAQMQTSAEGLLLIAQVQALQKKICDARQQSILVETASGPKILVPYDFMRD